VSGRLVVCPTPIGNLEDVTLRVLAALREADVVACEDTRRTRVLLDRYGVRARLVSYHEHNEQARAAELVGRMRDGEVVALVSDAGMPLVSDPGYVLVRGCVAAGLPVEVLPGPSAAITALVASGLPADEWRFHGFLPRKRGELRRLLAEPGGTLVAFESPRRVPATLALLAEVDPQREAAVCRELTKAHEEIVRGRAAELAARYANSPPRGEVVLVLGPPSAPAPARARPRPSWRS
jgi:16S rRNA (cytidine1402-2'-O)-methyltransferase